MGFERRLYFRSGRRTAAIQALGDLVEIAADLADLAEQLAQ
jgi:hypothetical protein